MPRLSTLRAGLLALLLAALAAAAACSGGGSDGVGNDGPNGGGAPRVIADGTLLAPPYAVAVDGATVLVNDVRSSSFAAPPAPDPESVDANATLDVLALVELGRLAYVNADGGAAGLAAATAALEGRPDVRAVAVTHADGIVRLTVTDRAGMTASLVPDPPDNAVRSPSDAERAAAAAAVAQTLRAHLDGGGGLVIARTGVTLMIPPGEIESLLAGTDAAMALDGAARRAALLALYEDEGIVDEVIEHYEPRKTTRALPAPAGPGAPRLIGFDAGTRAPDRPVFQGSPQSAKTPASPQAWVFVTLYWADAQGFIDALSKEGYAVRIYNFYDQAQPAGSAWGAFLRTSGSGAVYFATHSDASGISIQSFPQRADANTAAGRLEAQITAGDLSWWQEGDGTWWLHVTTQGIRGHWQSADSIVHSASCHSVTLAGAFNAREFFGYEPTTSCAIATPDTNRLWRRLTGEDGLGSLREASDAFGAGGFSAGFRHNDGSPGEGTVISPSVQGTLPAEPVPVGAESFVLVRFDANMDRTQRPPLVVEISGCLAPTSDGAWQIANVLTVPVRATAPGEAIVRVSARHARSELGRLALDGNQTPEGTSGVADNGDDYVFSVTCVAAQTATETATPALPPPPGTPATGTGSSGGAGGTTGEVIVVNDSSAPLRDGYVRIEVLVYEGEHYPLVQFHVAGADACDASHYHAGEAFSLEGSWAPDPNRAGCGFGRVSEVAVVTVDAVQSVVDRLPFTP